MHADGAVVLAAVEVHVIAVVAHLAHGHHAVAADRRCAVRAVIIAAGVVAVIADAHRLYARGGLDHFADLPIRASLVAAQSAWWWRPTRAGLYGYRDEESCPHCELALGPHGSSLLW